MKDEIQTILARQKFLTFSPSWIGENGSEFVSIVSSLDIDEVTLEGWRFRAKAHLLSPDMEVTFQLEALKPLVSSKYLPIVRINWLPRSPHNNKGRGPKALRFQQLEGSHIHPFEDNWPDGNPIRGNLPIAIPLGDNLSTFQSALEYVEDAFKVFGVSKLKVPPWEAKSLL